MNPITRKEMFLAAAGGQNVETPTPVTREEVFLDEIAKGGGGGLPSTETASAGDVLSLDDNKEPQWAPPSSGGGVLVVNVDMQTRTLDKTWKEISDAPFAVVRFPHPEMSGTAIAYNTITYIISGSTYEVRFNDPSYGVTKFVANSEDGYPSFSE